MKSLYKLVFSSCLTAMGLFGLQGSAMALTSINANICQLANAGTFDARLTLPAAQVPAFSQQVLVCLLPAESSLFDIQPGA
jgi:hypothetical protein